MFSHRVNVAVGPSGPSSAQVTCIRGRPQSRRDQHVPKPSLSGYSNNPVADASHEPRTPFAAMRPQVDVALEGALDEEQIRIPLLEIGQVLDRGSELVSDLAVTDAPSAVTLRVGNDGPLIAPDETEALVSRFHRGSLPSRTPGFGLGLWIVTTIATAHHADLADRIRPTGGLSISVTFPSHQPQGYGAHRRPGPLHESPRSSRSVLFAIRTISSTTCAIDTVASMEIPLFGVSSFD